MDNEDFEGKEGGEGGKVRVYMPFKVFAHMQGLSRIAVEPPFKSQHFTLTEATQPFQNSPTEAKVK